MRRCTTCGRAGPLESNHVAGRENDPDTVTDMCPPCHRRFTNWQDCLGVDLAEQDVRPLAMRLRGTLAGLLLIREAFYIQTHDRRSAHLMRLVARWSSAFLAGALEANGHEPRRPDPMWDRHTLWPRSDRRHLRDAEWVNDFEPEFTRIVEASGPIAEADEWLRPRVQPVLDLVWLAGFAWLVMEIGDRVQREVFASTVAR